MHKAEQKLALLELRQMKNACKGHIVRAFPTLNAHGAFRALSMEELEKLVKEKYHTTLSLPKSFLEDLRNQTVENSIAHPLEFKYQARLNPKDKETVANMGRLNEVIKKAKK